MFRVGMINIDSMLKVPEVMLRCPGADSALNHSSRRAEGYAQGQVGQTCQLVCLVAQEHERSGLTYTIICPRTSLIK
jgi:hypothetical protein